jgi:hypothetical protein
VFSWLPYAFANKLDGSDRPIISQRLAFNQPEAGLIIVQNQKARSMATTETSRRRRFAFSLRTLMIVVLIVGGLFGWKANRAYTQRQAVAAIREAKGSITYDFQDFPPGTSGKIRQARSLAAPNGSGAGPAMNTSRK